MLEVKGIKGRKDFLSQKGFKKGFKFIDFLKFKKYYFKPEIKQDEKTLEK